MGYSLLLCQGETSVATIEDFTSNQPNAGLRPAIWSRGQARLVSWVASPSPSSPIKGGINNFSYRSGILQMGPRSPSGSVYPWRKGSGGSTIPWRSRHSLAATLSLRSGSGSIKYHSDLRPKDAQLTPLLRLGAGACAGIIAMSATYPMDMVRGRITVQTDKSPYQYRGMFHALGTVYREEGFRALYKGWLPSVIGVVPYVGLNFAVYESLKDWLLQTNSFGLANDNELHVVTRLGCGAVAGTIGQTVAYPLDVIRRRMQMVGWSHADSIVTGQGKEALQYNGMIDAFRKTVRHEGVGALYKGLVPNSVKVVPSIAIAFVTYEVVKDVLGVEMRISD
ncbi:Mitochondrial adenine nucleotide transporter ADNT1 [Zea mays]|uniref:Mitochondrial adenine nucleotide transporter ADNT1 n=1 Tax=Zea mays TaxID=4577 RepID=A0A3L6E8A9_MAIZE|nr:Mitochondrial adenine nucleotide transporter ADNT1 [Zea mays]